MLLPPPLLHSRAPLLQHSRATYLHSPTLMTSQVSDTTNGVNAEIATVALPILAACLAEPVLSMIDTACVGRLAGAGAITGLAALNVNAAIFNMMSVCTSFLCTASTAVVGRATAATTGSESTAAASRSFRDGMLISFSLGTVLMAATLLNRNSILTRGFGLASTSAAFAPARRYLTIRALSLPAASATLVAVGVSLGLQDSMTPLLGVLLAFVVNVCGDILCVWRLGWGLVGAAIATACATYASAFLICGKLARRLRPIEWRRQIAGRDFTPFVACSGALLAGTTMNSLTYTSSSRVVAASGDVAMAAAHQIALQGWWLLSFVTVPLSLAGQSLLPKRAKQQPALAACTVRALAKFGAVGALLTAGCNALLTTSAAPWFTLDAAVLTPLRSLTALVVVSQAAISLATALDGCFIGCSWLRHYIVACSLGTAAALSLMARSLPQGGGLLPAWRGLLVFSLLRVAAHLVLLPRLLASLSHSSDDAKGMHEVGEDEAAATRKVGIADGSDVSAHP